MIGTSWTHFLARWLMRPLVGTWVRPNHLTTLRALTGLAACVLFAFGTRAGTAWGGVFWLVSAFLDRADGELARIGNMMSPGGHIYDFYTDVLVNVGFFVAIGFGLRHSWFGGWAIVLGFITGAALLMVLVFSEIIERLSPPNTRAYSGRWGFDPDDALYLLAPLAWLGWLNPVLLASSVVTTIIMVQTGLRVMRLRRGS